MKKISLFILAIVMTSGSVFAQEQASYSEAGKSAKRGVAAVMFATIGGAVLGLSTLSFYGKPQEHTNNISNGALIGAVAGLGYIIYDYNRPVPSGSYDFSQGETPDSKLRKSSYAVTSKEIPVFRYQWDF